MVNNKKYLLETEKQMCSISYCVYARMGTETVFFSRKSVFTSYLLCIYFLFTSSLPLCFHRKST